jgi:uncharacterized protein YcgI (DUF1989 family)
VTCLITIPARKGKAALLRGGELLRLVNTHGQQVVDTWAFNRDDLNEYMSMAHSHAELSKTLPTTGDTLVSNRRRPMLTFVEDNSGGIHDTVIAACDRYRYERLGVAGHHDNCTDNLRAALAQLGLEPPEIPPPLNLFMNIPVAADGTLSFQPSIAAPGSHVVLRAERDLVVVFSACPQDIVPINGADCVPKDAHFEILPATQPR